MPSKTNPNPSPLPKSDRRLIPIEVPLYLKKITDDFHDTIAISRAWPVIERVIMASQWELNTDAACQAAKVIMNNFLLLKIQGDLDIKTAQQ